MNLENSNINNKSDILGTSNISEVQSQNNLLNTSQISGISGISGISSPIKKKKLQNIILGEGDKKIELDATSKLTVKMYKEMEKKKNLFKGNTANNGKGKSSTNPKENSREKEVKSKK